MSLKKPIDTLADHFERVIAVEDTRKMHEGEYLCRMSFISHVQRGKTEALFLGENLLPLLHMAFIHVVYIHD